MKEGCMVGVVVLALLALLALGYALYPAQQAGRIYKKTLDADNVVYNYEYFKQAWQDYGALREKLGAAEEELATFKESAGPRADWTFEDKQEFSRLTANVTGIKNIQADIKATYNARANMVNRSLFMGGDVPQQIN